MPHVVLEGAIALPDLCERLSPVLERSGSRILKTGDVYVNGSGSSGLIEAIVVEGGPPQNFFVHLSKKDMGVTVRLFPLTDPKKTPGVKRLLALVARKIKSLYPSVQYGKTNLEEYLAEPEDTEA